MAAMPTQVIHGLCSMPAQVSAPNRPPGASTRWISAKRDRWIGREHQPHAARDDVEGIVGTVDGRRVDHRDVDVVERRVAAAGNLDHARGDVAEQRPCRSGRRAPTTRARGCRAPRPARAPGRPAGPPRGRAAPSWPRPSARRRRRRGRPTPAATALQSRAASPVSVMTSSSFATVTIEPIQGRCNEIGRSLSSAVVRLVPPPGAGRGDAVGRRAGGARPVHRAGLRPHDHRRHRARRRRVGRDHLRRVRQQGHAAAQGLGHHGRRRRSGRRLPRTARGHGHPQRARPRRAAHAPRRLLDRRPPSASRRSS